MPQNWYCARFNIPPPKIAPPSERCYNLPSNTLTWPHLPLRVIVSVLGYASIYRRNTLDPIHRIINTGDDDEATKEEIERWARAKLKEAQYVQVAVSFAICLCGLLNF